jgi:DNA modification methylase
MAKKKHSPDQPDLFPKRPIPQMPEGYYSSGPNPNLRQFVEEHATTYDPETDDYNELPFDKPITTTKATAVFNLHSYHQGKKSHEAIRQYINHYTNPEDIVLDPFCGSGSTALASLIEGRKTIAIDLSPAATFITKNYCTPENPDEIMLELSAIQRITEPDIAWLYETRCDRCEGKAVTGYVVYSYVFQCNRCTEKIPLFDCECVKVLTESGENKSIRVCPICYTKDLQEEISTTKLKRFNAIPVLVSYLCQDGCKPKRDQRRYDDPDPKKRQYFKHYDLGKIQEIVDRRIPHRYPSHRMMNVKSDTEPWGDKWRAGTSNFRTVAELYTKRNLWALAAIKDAVKQSPSLCFALTGISLNTSKMIRESNTQYLAGTYYLPQISKEVNVWSSFSRRAKQVADYMKSVTPNFKSLDLMISTQSATDLTNISSNSVDYIFTDPPYGDNVQYGELNFIWESWMNFDTQWLDNEIIVNKTRNKSDYEWAQLIRQAMQECFRVLKPGRWITLCYHDTSEGTWGLIQDIMAEVGFISEKTELILYIDKTAKSYNQYVASKVTKRDLVINFRKPRQGEFIAQFTLFGDEDAATFHQKARNILIKTLVDHPGSLSDRIYDELVSRMVRKGEFERHNFNELLNSVAEEVNGRWYLLETADQVDGVESDKEIAVTALLERYMEEYLEENPGEIGVHFSELFEQYLYVQDKPRRLLKEWLPEYFYLTEEDTWRLPANEEERDQKDALRTSGTLRRIKRFANALLVDVPPHERDLPNNTATAADWIRQCRRAGLYDQGRALYEKGGFTFDRLDEEAQMEVEEDYQICVRRS